MPLWTRFARRRDIGFAGFFQHRPERCRPPSDISERTARRNMGNCLSRASLPAADASDNSVRAGVEDPSDLSICPCTEILLSRSIALTPLSKRQEPGGSLLPAKKVRARKVQRRLSAGGELLEISPMANGSCLQGRTRTWRGANQSTGVATPTKY
jgi:hypothetical protein